VDKRAKVNKLLDYHDVLALEQVYNYQKDEATIIVKDKQNLFTNISTVYAARHSVIDDCVFDVLR